MWVYLYELQIKFKFRSASLIFEGLRPLKFEHFSFPVLFLNDCRYWSDCWYEGSSGCFKDQVQVSFRSINFWRSYGPLTLKILVFRTLFLNDCRYWSDFLYVGSSGFFKDQSLSFVPIDLFLKELRPLNFEIFSIPYLVSKRLQILIWCFVCGSFLMSY